MADRQSSYTSLITMTMTECTITSFFPKKKSAANLAVRHSLRSLLLLLVMFLAGVECWGQLPTEPVGSSEENDSALFGEDDAIEPEESMARSLYLSDSVDRAAVNADLDVFSFGLDFIPSPGAGSFFDGYALLFGTENALAPAVSPAIIGRIRMSDKLRLVVAASFITTGFTDIYDAYTLRSGSGSVDTSSLVPVAQIFDDMNVIAAPLLGGVQFSPIRSQFTSYVGAAVGGAFVNISWITKSRLIENSQFFRPETNVEGSRLAPALKLFTGVDLRFDRFFDRGDVLRGIYLEASYLYLPVTDDYFHEIRTIGRRLPLVPEEESATINLGGFAIMLGVNLQLVRE